MTWAEVAADLFALIPPEAQPAALTVLSAPEPYRVALTAALALLVVLCGHLAAEGHDA